MTCFWAKALGQELGPTHSAGYWRAQQELDSEWPVPSCLPKEKPQGCVREHQLGGKQRCQAYAETPNRPPKEGTSRGECEVPETRRAVPGSIHLQGLPYTHLFLSGWGLIPRPPGQLLAVFQGGQQPHGPPLGVGGLLLIPHTKAALGVLGVPGGWQPCGSMGVGLTWEKGRSKPGGPPVFCTQPLPSHVS